MTSQIRPHKTIMYCNKDLERDKQYQAEISTPEQVRFKVMKDDHLRSEMVDRAWNRKAIL